jgi:hypothetical protein
VILGADAGLLSRPRNNEHDDDDRRDDGVNAVGADEESGQGATKQPDGQISKNLSSPRAKNIPLNPSGKSAL